MRHNHKLLTFLCVLCAFVVNLPAQEKPPAPSAPKSVTVPPVIEKKLPNGLTVAVVERKNVPLVTIAMLIRSGASAEASDKAGLANLTADMLTKGTKTRTATQIAEAVEFLGGSINTVAGWNSSTVSMTVTSDKVEQALEIMADVILNPKFDQKELDLLKSQTLDELNANLKQPGFIASYVASKYSFDEHPAGGTPTSLSGMSAADVAKFHKENYYPSNAVLIFTGNISAVQASAFAARSFSRWPAARTVIMGAGDSATGAEGMKAALGSGPTPPIRLLVIDLPKSGQAAVAYARHGKGIGRTSQQFYPAVVMNSVLGGGYSARLNYEIRIKRGLSYGAGSSIAWRPFESNFATRAQTKNQSAAEVADLTLDEVKKLTKDSVGRDELVPRKSVLTGNFGRNLETTAGLANAIGDLYAFGIPTSELNAYVSNVNAIADTQIKSFASQNLLGGDIIIVGDYSVFKDDLANRFPKMNVAVIKADDLDLSKPNLRK